MNTRRTAPRLDFASDLEWTDARVSCDGGPRRVVLCWMLLYAGRAEGVGEGARIQGATHSNELEVWASRIPRKD